MNDEQLKTGLRQLANEGWFIVRVNDELLESLLGEECEPPSDETKQRFLTKFRTRIQEAALRGEDRPIAKRKSTRSERGV